MSKKDWPMWSVRVPPDLYAWKEEITRRLPGKAYYTNEWLAEEALRDLRKKLTRHPGRRTDDQILAAKDAVIMDQSKRELRRRRKPKP